MLLFSLLLLITITSSQYTCPFTKLLSPGSTGNDVLIAQTLLTRSPFVGPNSFAVNGNYGMDTAAAVKEFQGGNNMTVTGNIDADTSNLLLEKHTYDGYKDNGTIPDGYLYKVHIKVSRNRSEETWANLYNNKLELLLTFRVRLHGETPRNQFCTDGDTPTGLAYLDLNSPEDDPKDFGPYPINRLVKGIEGNAALLLQNTVTTPRSGILIHTGEWDNWAPPDTMPNSDGCIHTWPDFCDLVWQILVTLGANIRNNPGGVLPYQYAPQGIISIEQYD